MPENSQKVSVQKDQGKNTSLQIRSDGGWSPFETLQREVERIFDDFGRDWGLPAPRRWFGRAPRSDSAWTVPAIDVAEKDGAYEITAELPGIDEKNVEVTLADGVLSIRGDKADERDEKHKDYRLSERRYGSFERSFLLPDDIDTDKIQASFKKGVLTLSLPRQVGVKQPTKKIAIKSS